MGCRIVSWTNWAKYGSGLLTLRCLPDSLIGAATACAYSGRSMNPNFSMSWSTMLRCFSAATGWAMGS